MYSGIGLNAALAFFNGIGLSEVLIILVEVAIPLLLLRALWRWGKRRR